MSFAHPSFFLWPTFSNDAIAVKVGQRPKIAPDASGTALLLRRWEGRENALDRAVQVAGCGVGADGTGRRSPPDQRLAVGPVHVQVQRPELVALDAAVGIVVELDRDDEIGIGRRFR